MRTWFHNVKPVVEDEENYIKIREDIVSLRHGREWAGFDGFVEYMLHKLNCELVRVCGARTLLEKTLKVIATDCRL